MFTKSTAIFENNLRLLSPNYNQLADALKIFKIPSFLKILQSKSGLFTAEFQITPNCSKLLHSAFDPREEADSWAQQQNLSADVFVLLGLGLGYPALSLLNQGFSGRLILVEKDMGIFKMAFTYSDLSSIIKNENISLFIDQETDGLLSFLNRTAVGFLRYTSYHPAAALHRQYYEEIRHGLDKIIYEQRRIVDSQFTDGVETLLQVMKD